MTKADPAVPLSRSHPACKDPNKQRSSREPKAHASLYTGVIVSNSTTLTPRPHSPTRSRNRLEILAVVGGDGDGLGLGGGGGLGDGTGKAEAGAGGLVLAAVVAGGGVGGDVGGKNGHLADFEGGVTAETVLGAAGLLGVDGDGDGGGAAGSC